MFFTAKSMIHSGMIYGSEYTFMNLGDKTEKKNK